MFSLSFSHRAATSALSKSLRRPGGGLSARYPNMKTTILTSKRNFGGEVIQQVQEALYLLKTSTGLSWWATFVTSTVMVRIALIPLHLARMRVAGNFSKAGLDIAVLQDLYVRKIAAITKAKGGSREKLKAAASFFKGVMASCRLNGVSFFKFIGYPVLNISCFLTFIFSLRGMLDSEKYKDVKEGGMMWFKDLTVTDASNRLPMISLFFSYLAIEVAMLGTPTGFPLMMKDFFQCIPILLLPFMMYMPAGVFCYWIPGNIFSIFQSLMLKNRALLRRLNLPVPRKPTAPQINQVSTDPSVPVPALTAEQKAVLYASKILKRK